MKYRNDDAEYYAKLIENGIKITGQLVPGESGAVGLKIKQNKNSEDVRVCLTCVKRKCTGTEKCYAERMNALVREKRRSIHNVKEVVK